MIKQCQKHITLTLLYRCMIFFVSWLKKRKGDTMLVFMLYDFIGLAQTLIWIDSMLDKEQSDSTERKDRRISVLLAWCIAAPTFRIQRIHYKL